MAASSNRVPITLPGGMSPALLLVIGVLVLLATVTAHSGPAIPGLAKYEPLSYDTAHIHKQHVRYRRSISKTDSDDDTVSIVFQGLGREFHLQLTDDKTDLHPALKIERSNKKNLYLKDIDMFYHGSDLHDNGSYVHGAVINGRFVGRIRQSSGEQLLIDPIEFRLDQSDDENKVEFHSVLYNHEDFEEDIGEDDLTDDSIDEDMMEGLVDDDWKVHDEKMDFDEFVKEFGEEIDEDDADFKDTISEKEEEGDYVEGEEVEGKHSRSKRRVYRPESGMAYYTRRGKGIIRFVFPFTMDECEMRKYCTVQIITDPLLYEKMGSEEAIIAYLLTTFRMANTALKAQAWAPGIAGFSLVLTNIVIVTDFKDLRNPYQAKYVRAIKDDHMLRIHPKYALGRIGKVASLEPQTYCMNWFISFRTGYMKGVSFVGGYWKIGSSGVGGILNTHVTSVATSSFGRVNNAAAIGFILTHETGHMFGSSHPILKTPRSTPSEDVRLDDHALSIINLKLLTRKYYVFKESLSLCGNNLIDEGEDCDCGSKTECEEIDPCCTPPGMPYECQFTAGSECSAMGGPCCHGNCTLITAENSTCNTDSCKEVMYCDGVNAACPVGADLPFETACEDGVCLEGTCIPKSCEAHGYEECLCPIRYPQRYHDRFQCRLCCVHNGACKVNSRLPQMSIALYRDDYVKCNGADGFCYKKKCQTPGSSFDTMSENEETPLTEEYSTWTSENIWIYFVFVGGAVFVTISLIIISSLLITSSNPRFTAERTLANVFTRQLFTPSIADNSDTEYTHSLVQEFFALFHHRV